MKNIYLTFFNVLLIKTLIANNALYTTLFLYISCKLTKKENIAYKDLKSD